jgi:F-type H+-transporting ATPase subunit b
VELDWTTFILEIINFLVLLWLLKRLLYKPVLNVIARRKAEIEKRVADSLALRQEAESLRAQYERRIIEWEQERTAARSRLLEDIGMERARLTAALRASLDQERDKQRALEERRLNELAGQAEETAVAQGVKFATLLLSRLASAELEAQLVRVLLEDLHKLPEAQRTAIRSAASETAMPITVTSAYPLMQAGRNRLTEFFAELLGRPASFVWRQDPELKAGVRLSLGFWVLSATLQDELRFFREANFDAATTEP